MSESVQRLEPGMQVGDYYLKELIYEGDATRTWLAKQVSVSREVIIDSLKSMVHDDEGTIASYLGDVRAKAKVDHPLIGSVFEAVHEEGIYFYAREKIPGDTLEDKVLNKEKLTPKEIAHIISQMADANLYLESNSMASLPLQSNQLFISETGMGRIINMAVGGERNHNVSTLDKVMLGESFSQVLKLDEPGATRVASLLGFMADKEREIPLTWEQIKKLAEGVEKQLADPLATASMKTATKSIHIPKGKYGGIIIGSLLGLALIGGITTIFINHSKVPKKRELDQVVLVDVRESELTKNMNVQPFTIDAHEVTIGEYAKFLRGLSEDVEKLIKHPKQPDYKTSYVPDDWDNMYQAAKDGKKWNGLTLSLNCPVVGVDWWDAYIYAAMKSRRLPTQNEWRAAFKISETDPENLVSSNWGPVDQETGDVTANKIYGLAGNVAEWCLKSSKPATDPMAVVKKPVILGGSYNDESIATSRRWLDPSDGNEDARDLRRRDIGFRTVGEPE